ncbi:cytochrome P450 [Amniculicola lignicola CBS 123094]|uniref:Cytochrome P450 n=1 Tax=Amniculicola lignicola CBS 123094 TaxID=1392246 RepID=A0A6A5WBB5_9PLEO|nr:cytochrome P450 [Amniculicola lignicola CBS 123094]
MSSLKAMDYLITTLGSTEVSAALVLFGMLYLFYEWMLPKPYPGIPYDQKAARRLLGDGPEMLREVGLTREVHIWLLKKVTELQEPLCQVFIQPFAKPWIILSDSVEAQNVMTRRPEFERSDFDRTSLSALDGFHSRHQMGDVWKRTRAWLQDLLSPGFLNNTVSPILYESSLLLIDYWDKKVRLANDRPFDCNDDLDHFALDGMMSFVFDKEYRHAGLIPQNEAARKLEPSSVEIGRNGEAKFPHVQLNKFAAAMYGTVDTINATTATFWPRLGQYYVRQRPAFHNAIATRRQVIEQQVQAALKRFETTGKPETAIEFMLFREKKAAEKQGRKPDYTNTVLRDEIGGQFLAGYHTSSSTLGWIFIHLTRTPDIQTKLRSAVHAAFSTAHAEKRVPTHAEMLKTRVPYVDAVIDEVLRLHATIMSRMALRDTQIFGKHIPKGATVWMLCNGPGFHSPSFDDAIKKRGPSTETDFSKDWDESRDMFTFEPERWLRPKKGVAATDEDVEFNANAAPQAAFGLGMRGCWGRKLAYVELRMLVALVVWHFDLLPVTPALNNTPATWSVIHRSDACYLRMRRRNDTGKLELNL